MAYYCFRITLPIVETENPEQLADKISESLQELVKYCPVAIFKICEYNPEIFKQD